MNATHHPNLKSSVESANDPAGDFPIQNLPYGVFQPGIIGVAIGDRILNLRACAEAGLLPEPCREPARAKVLNPLMSLDRITLCELRRRLVELLQFGTTLSSVSAALLSRKDAPMMLPAEVGDYTDFYASIHHATNVGRLFRPDNPLVPNYKWVPIAYHGRASSIVVSGTAVRRPSGQRKRPEDPAPEFGPSLSLDYELETGFFLANGNALADPIPIDTADSHLFGMCLVNDWSARDIQAWEYQPLGPFLGKNFATSISPWVVTMEALEPFRVPRGKRAEGDPAPLPYLDSENDRKRGAIDVRLTVHFSSRLMREEGKEPMLLSRTSLENLYWTPAQMVAHHTSNGCNLRPGDLLASGTVSGPGEGQLGSLLEITRRGAQRLRLPTGEDRAFLESGDEVILRGCCQRDGFARIGFGECSGHVA